MHLIAETLCLAILAPAAEPIMMDGRFEDWPTPSSTDAWTIQGAADEDSLFLLVHHPGPPRVIQQLDQPTLLGLDLDDQVDTGCPPGPLQGCDLAFELSPAGSSRNKGGISAWSWTKAGKSKKSPYRYGFVAAPSTASRSHEFRIDRDELPELASSIRVVLAPGQEPTVTTTLNTQPRRPVSKGGRRGIPRPAKDGLRVVSWNIEHGGMLKRSEVVHSILKELDPDVLLIQELQDNQGPEAIRSFLEGIQPGEKWTVSMSPTGSSLRTAVATRRAATPTPAFDCVTRSDNPNQVIRATGLLVEDGDGPPSLAVSIHLKCCGGLNGREDITRISEILSIREAIEAAVDEHQPDGLIIGGDFNLVASPVPLDIIHLDGQAMLGPDREGNLVLAEASHLDRGDTYTWYNERSQFTPGRLDFVLTGGDLVQTRAFIFDTTDLLPRDLGSLQADATGTASDHLPVVVDITATR